MNVQVLLQSPLKDKFRDKLGNISVFNIGKTVDEMKKKTVDEMEKKLNKGCLIKKKNERMWMM